MAVNYWDEIEQAWAGAKRIIGRDRVTLGPQATQQWLDQPEHLTMVLARYRAAAALIGGARRVMEAGSGEGLGAGILAKGRDFYCGIDSDSEAVKIARETFNSKTIAFAELDVLATRWLPGTIYDAAVSLDVIEHIPADQEDRFFSQIVGTLTSRGVCVIGTPNAAFDHLASPQSKAGHINTYTHDRLHALMSRYFHVVQDFGMNDVALHLGHPEARHYLLLAGIGPR